VRVRVRLRLRVLCVFEALSVFSSTPSVVTSLFFKPNLASIESNKALLQHAGCV